MKTTCINPRILGTDEREDEAASHESTYALLVRSEEKERTLLETVAYFLVVLSAIAAIYQFAKQPIALPLKAVTTIADTMQVSERSAQHLTNFRG